MARHLLFCEEETGKTPRKLENSRSVKYSYTKGILSVYRYETMVFQGPASYCGGFEIHTTMKKTVVKKLSPPRGKVEIIAWLCGAPYWVLCSSEQEYEDKIAEYNRYNKNLCISTEWDVLGSTFKFMWNKKEGEKTRPYCIACFISDAITLSEIMELLPMMQKAGYPDWYLFNTLNKRFGVTAEMFDEALNHQR